MGITYSILFAFSLKFSVVVLEYEIEIKRNTVFDGDEKDSMMHLKGKDYN